MPSRILREGIVDSGPVNSLSHSAEVFYRRLMSVVDDHGRYDGRPVTMRGKLFAHQLDRVSIDDVKSYIAECVTQGLIRVYQVDGKPYVMMFKIGKPRSDKSKFPDPPEMVVTKAEVAAYREGMEELAFREASFHEASISDGADDAPAAAVTDVPERSTGAAPAAPVSDVPYSYSGSDAKESASQSGKPPTATKAVAVRNPPTGPFHDAIRLFQARWKAMYGEDYPIDYAGKDGKAFSTMLKKKCGENGDKLLAAIGRYFDDDDGWIASNTRHSVGHLLANFHKWIVDAPRIRHGPKSKGELADEYAAKQVVSALFPEDDFDEPAGQERPAIEGHAG